jgi:hypothetical protein
MKLYMFRAVPLPIIRSLFAVHSAMVYAVQVCRQLSSRIRMDQLMDSSSFHQQEFIHCTLSNGICLQTCMTYTIAEYTVNILLLMDRGTVHQLIHPGPARKLSTNQYGIYHC